MNKKHVVSILLASLALSQTASAQMSRGEKSHPGREAARPASAQTTADDPIVIGHTITLSSKILGEDRRVTISVPRAYNDVDTEYPVVYVLDGAANFRTVYGATDFLSRYGMMPHVIVVAVHNGRNREYDMTPPDMSMNLGMGNGGRADKFLDFMEQELFPYIQTNYRTAPFRLLHGHSHGAIVGTYALTARPDMFRWHLLMDMPPRRGDSYIEREMFEFLEKHSDYRGRMVSVNQIWGWESGDWQQLLAQTPDTFYLDRLKIPDESHETMLYHGSYLGFKSLFHDYSRESETRTQSLAQLSARYDAKSVAYGYRVKIPKRLIRDNIMDLLFQRRGREAKALIEYAIATYGPNAGYEQSLGEAEAAIVAGPLDETVADMLGYRHPSAKEIAPFIGTWQGKSHHKGGVPVDTRVVISIKDGRSNITTTTKFPGRSWGEAVEPVMMRLLNDGTLEWGSFNNRIPHVPMVHSARLSGDSLNGTMKLRGIEYPFEMPVIHLNLKRVTEAR